MLLEYLEPRLCPAMTYHGGVVLGQVVVAEVAVDMPPVSPALVSDYLSHLGAYGVQGGYVDTVVQLPSAGPLDDAQVKELLKYEVAAGQLPGPDGFSRLYLVLTPVNEGPQIGAWHSYWKEGFIGAPYCVSPDLFGATHELAEGATDPFLSGWYDSSPYTGEAADVTHGAGTILEGQSVALTYAWNGPYTPLPQPPPLLQTMADAYYRLLWSSYVGDKAGTLYWRYQFELDYLQAGAI
jgi:hypothetical protein